MVFDVGCSSIDNGLMVVYVLVGSSIDLSGIMNIVKDGSKVSIFVSYQAVYLFIYKHKGIFDFDFDNNYHIGTYFLEVKIEQGY